MNVDHLFDDDAILLMPSRPPTKELYQRLDELRGGGCCQSVAQPHMLFLHPLTFDRGIAWSKWGGIASIASNGAALELRNLRVHPDNGSWSLSEPSTTPNFASSLDGGPLKHLSWSPTGCDLAVIDASGRVTIMSVFSSLNKPSMSRPCSIDPADDLHAIVGSFWLNVAPYPLNRPVCQVLSLKNALVSYPT
jgi:mediator of RNA polymerase II transcription subunit 16